MQCGSSETAGGKQQLALLPGQFPWSKSSCIRYWLQRTLKALLLLSGQEKYIENFHHFCQFGVFISLAPNSVSLVASCVFFGWESFSDVFCALFFLPAISLQLSLSFCTHLFTCPVIESWPCSREAKRLSCKCGTSSIKPCLCQKAGRWP